MAENYTPAYTDALRDTYAGKAGQDPRAYSSDVARRVDYKYSLNPAYNEILALIRGSVASGTYRQTWTCGSGDAVGDPAYISAANTVAKADATTAAKAIVVGFIRYKPTTTSCYLDHLLYKSGLTGLTAGAAVFLTDAGGFSATPGTVRREVGIAISTTAALLEAYPLTGSAHAASHITGGGDIIPVATTSAVGLTPAATAPGAGLLSVLAIGNGETVRTDKALFDTTNPEALGVAAPGTQVIAARRDHVHAAPAPTAHAASHVTGGGDTIADAVSEGNSGLMSGADKKKLNDIEAGADVTDATNVASAGALMMSEYLAKGDIIVGVSAGNIATLGVGTNGQVLTAASAETEGVKWATPNVGRGYIDGFILSNHTDTDHDIQIGAGACRDSSDAVSMAGSALIKQIDAAWAAGTNAGGLFTGSVGNSTWYHVFAIRKDSDGSVDFGFDTSVTAANKPAGYSYYRRIGSVLTNGSANIIQFYQVGDEFQWDDPPLDVYEGTLTTTQTLLALSVPPDVNAIVNFRLGISKYEATPLVIVKHPSTDDDTPSHVGSPLADIFCRDVGEIEYAEFRVLTNTAKQIGFTADQADTVYSVVTIGYTDFRGKQ